MEDVRNFSQRQGGRRARQTKAGTALMHSPPPPVCCLLPQFLPSIHALVPIGPIELAAIRLSSGSLTLSAIPLGVGERGRAPFIDPTFIYLLEMLPLRARRRWQAKNPLK